MKNVRPMAVFPAILGLFLLTMAAATSAPSIKRIVIPPAAAPNAYTYIRVAGIDKNQVTGWVYSEWVASGTPPQPYIRQTDGFVADVGNDSYDDLLGLMPSAIEKGFVIGGYADIPRQHSTFTWDGLHGDTTVPSSMFATGISPSGHRLVGYVPLPTVPLTVGGAIYSLGTVSFIPGSPLRAQPASINDNGDVAGFFVPHGRINAFFMRSGSVPVNIGDLLPLDEYSAATKLNNAGQVIGRWYGQVDPPDDDSPPPPTPVYAFVYSASSGKLLPRLPSVDGGTGPTSASDINSSSEIVGSSTDLGGAVHPVVWMKANGIWHVVDLNKALAAHLPGSGWVLSTADAVNDSGDIAGLGTRNGIVGAYVLKGLGPLFP